MRISDWSSDVCSSDLLIKLAIDRGSWREGVMDYHNKVSAGRRQWYGCKVWNNYLRINSATKGFVNCGTTPKGSSVASNEIGRASCRERGCQTCRSRWSPYH